MTLERLQQSISRYREAIVAFPSRGSRTLLSFSSRSDPSESVSIAPPSDAQQCEMPPRVQRDLLESMLTARHLDRLALELRSQGVGLYTITSTGHESNVVLGRLLRTTDPSLLHYRSTALFVERARQCPEVDAVRSIVLSLVGAREDPIAGGRHKVLGNHRMGVIPQTSTIASHLPRALGMAFMLEHRRGLGRTGDYPLDTVVMASFGDASVNHSTWLGSVNAAGWFAERGEPLPLLLVCEDNGLGISVRSPPGWLSRRLQALPHVTYFHADGRNLHQLFQVANRAVEHCRRQRGTALLHLSCARLLGHVGTDLDASYRSRDELRQAEAADPILHFAIAALERGTLDPEEVLLLDDAARIRVDAFRELAQTAPGLRTAAEILISLPPLPPPEHRPSGSVSVPIDNPTAPPLTLARGIHAALDEAIQNFPELVLFGEDVGVKGGIHGVTQGLAARHGSQRVFDTLLDEQTVLGLGLGAGVLGMLPVPEIQYLAFYHHAQDQLRGEAATLPFYSRERYRNPMVLRIAGLADPRGVGGHFHNDNSLADLRDVPGLLLAVVARADDALELYRSAFRLAREDGRVVVIIEPVGLYHERDLYEPGDRNWLATDTGQHAAVGRVRVYHESARALTLATFGRGVRVCLRAARELERAHGHQVRILDIRWLSPLPMDDLLQHSRETGGLLWVDDTRETGSVSETVAARFLDCGAGPSFARVTASDSWVPIGPAAAAVLPTEESVVSAALGMIGKGREPRS